MLLESKKYLYDVSLASGKIASFIDNKSFDDYTMDDLVKSAVERQFEVIGEALNQLSKIDSKLIEQISNYRQIISFRNILIHGYAEVDDRLVWNIVETKLATLITEIKALLA